MNLYTLIEDIFKFEIPIRLLELINHRNQQIASSALNPIVKLIELNSNTDTLIGYGLFNKIYPLISSEDDHIKAQAYWCVGSIIERNAECRKLAIEMETIPLLVDAINKNTSPLLAETYSWFTYCVCYHARDLPFKEVCIIVFPN